MNNPDHFDFLYNRHKEGEMRKQDGKIEKIDMADASRVRRGDEPEHDRDWQLNPKGIGKPKGDK